MPHRPTPPEAGTASRTGPSLGPSTWPVAWLLVVALAAGILVGRPDAAVAAVQVDYVLSAHPDDEPNSWSRIAGSSDTFTVLVYLTTGEETTGCAEDWFEETEDGARTGEVHPYPDDGAPPHTWGRNSLACYTARRQGTLAFLDAMAVRDDTVPGSLGFVGEVTLPYGDTTPVNHQRAGGEYVADTVRVYEDTADRGAVLFFDLGDADLTAEEVRWAVEAMRTHKAELGIPSELPERYALGNYRVDGLAGCRSYDHPDHRAIHEALDTHDMFDAEQLGRTCASDPRAVDDLTAVTPVDTHTSMFELGPDDERLGTFNQRYGWLFLGPYKRANAEGPAAPDAPPPDCGRDPSVVAYPCGSTMSRVQHYWSRSDS